MVVELVILVMQATTGDIVSLTPLQEYDDPVVCTAQTVGASSPVIDGVFTIKKCLVSIDEHPHDINYKPPRQPTI